MPAGPSGTSESLPHASFGAAKARLDEIMTALFQQDAGQVVLSTFGIFEAAEMILVGEPVTPIV